MTAVDVTHLVFDFAKLLHFACRIFWECLGLLIGTLGVLPLSVHSIACDVIDLLLMLAYGVGQALTLRVSATIALSVKGAKQLAWGCLIVSSVVFGLVSLAMYFFRYDIYRIFTKEQEVMDGCEVIWWIVCLTFFILAVFAINTGIMTGLGLQGISGCATVVFVWILSFPLVVYFAFVKGGGLPVAWYGVWVPYAAINVCMTIYLLGTDWYSIEIDDDSSIDEVDNQSLVVADKESCQPA
jgi:Na+-driven multidrug efflux pump